LSNHVDVSAKLDGLTGNVDQLLRSFRLLNQNLAQGGSRNHDAEIVTNLESCVRSAGKLVSSATTLVNSRSQRGSQFGSEFGNDLSDQERTRIEGWIPEPTIFEATDDQNLGHSLSNHPSGLSAGSLIPVAKKPHTPVVYQEPVAVPPDPPTVLQEPLAVPQVRTMSKQNAEITIQNSILDIDYDLIESLLTSAKNKFANKDYEGAEKVLQRILVRAKVTYSTGWKWRDEILRMLIVCYCQLEWWEEASQVLDQDFKGKEKEMAAVVTNLCLQDRLDAAKILLSVDFADRAKILELYAKRAYWRYRWAEAEEVLLKLLESQKPERSLDGYRTLELSLDRFRYMQALAEVRYVTGPHETAREVCLEAMYGRKNTLGKTHVLYYESVHLLVLICEAQNDHVEAEGYKALLPTEFKGTSLLIDHE
jgi:hypothetical protein